MKSEQSRLAVTLRGQGRQDRQGTSIHIPALPLVLAGMEGKVMGWKCPSADCGQDREWFPMGKGELVPGGSQNSRIFKIWL